MGCQSLGSARGLPRRLGRAFELIATYPGVGARALNAELSGVRRIHLSRIRHHLYYRVSPEAVEILALWHTGRGPNPVYERTINRQIIARSLSREEPAEETMAKMLAWWAFRKDGKG